MIEIITFVSDTKLFLKDMEAFPELLLLDMDEQIVGVKSYKTPSVRNSAGETLALLKVDSTYLDAIKTINSITILLEKSSIKDLSGMTDANRVIYDSVYDSSPINMVDGNNAPLIGSDGKQLVQIKPELFGVMG